MKRIKAALVGISGYTGMELARLLTGHNSMELAIACSRNEAGRKLGDFYPFLRGLPGGDLEISLYNPDYVAKHCDLAFLAVPAGTAMQMAGELAERGVKVVDFSADFRLVNPEIYEFWYKQEHTRKELLKEAVYGLPELNESKIAKARIVANPGCYPTASILGLCAALKADLIDPATIIIDAKSGASGAGRKAATANLFCEISDNFRAYGTPAHRHTPEIEQELSAIAQLPITLSFTPHLMPMRRGILATIYASLKASAGKLEEIHKIFVETWSGKPWIRVLPLGKLPETVNTRGSMFCDIGLSHDKRTNRLIILSAIDNLCRGASGQALANGNLLCGLPMEEGLKNLAPLL